MSIVGELESIPNEIREKIIKDLKIRKKQNEYSYTKSPWIIPFLVTDDDKVYIPFSYGLSLKSFSFSRPKENIKMKMKSVEFVGKLRDYQETLLNEEFLPTMNEKKSVILSPFPGWGKTTFAIYISSLIGLKTAIISHLTILLRQWEKSIQVLIKNAKIQIVTSKTILDENADFYIISAHIIEKLGHVFGNIGFVIIDEVHCIATDTLYKSMFYFTPRFLLGLSATPTRPDGMDGLLDFYFGTTRIAKSVRREHYCFKILTQITPTLEKTQRGTTDWNLVLTSLSENESRNEMIVNIIKIISKLYTKRTFLVLTKRVEHAKNLIEKLNRINIITTYLYGSKNDYDCNAKVLVATVKKAGLGFDHPNLSVLILATDVEEYFVQYLGRVLFRSKFTPWIFDLVDNYSSLLSHFYSRRKVYFECGGIIVKCPNPKNEKDFESVVKNIHG